MANVAGAFRQQHPGATVAKRTKGSIHLDTGDGKKVALFGRALHYGPGADQEIDTAWQPSTGAWQLEMVRADYNVHARNVFNAGNLLEWRKGEQWVVLDPQSLNWINQDNSRQQIAIKQAVGAQTADNLLSYPAAWGAGRHFSYQAGPDRLEKVITIDAPTDLPAPTVAGTVWLEAELALSTSADVDLYLDGVRWRKQNGVRVRTANRIEFRDAATGQQLFWHLDYPRAWDSAGNDTIGEMEVRRQGSGHFVTVRIPRAWVQAATFPIYVDPTLVDGPSGDVTSSFDTMLDYGNTTANAGASDRLMNWLSRGLLRFDASSIAADATCTQATLFLTQTIVASSEPNDVTIYSLSAANGDWIEGTKNRTLAGAGEPCWNAKEADGSGGVTTAWPGSNGCSTSGTDYESTALGTFDPSDSVPYEHEISLLTTRIEDWFGATNTNYGLLLMPDDAGGGPGRLASSDHTTAAYRPKLVVEYAEGGGATYTLTADAGSYTLTGGAVSLLVSRLLSAEAGSYTVTGNDAGLLASRLLSAEPGTYSLTGSDAALLAGRLLEAAAGSYTLTGNDAALIYTTLGGPTYTLVAEPGSYSLTGNDAALLASRLLTAEAGAYVLGGQDAVLLAGRRLAAEGGAYALTGNDAALIAARVLAAEPGAYALVGNAATLVYSGAEIPVTPDSRVFVVAAESRIYVIVLDDRTLVVPAESRTHAIRS